MTGVVGWAVMASGTLAALAAAGVPVAVTVVHAAVWAVTGDTTAFLGLTAAVWARHRAGKSCFLDAIAVAVACWLLLFAVAGWGWLAWEAVR